jgi:glutamyl-tRNA synthetase
VKPLTLTLKENEELREKIRRIALLNAVLHDGKAQAQPVLGKLLAEHPHLRAKVKVVTSIIAEVVEEVNRLSPIEQRELIKGIWPEAPAKEKVKEKELPPLPNAEKYVRIITRFSPNPDFVLHLGSARAIILSHEYAQMYKGLFYLRFEDTDPRLKKSALQFYDAIREDLTWLGCKWDAEFIQTDHFPTYYEHAERLLREGHAYVCTCKREEFRERIVRKEPCPCRSLPSEEHVARWRRMMDGTYREGEAVMRIKTDLQHPNPAVRDWPALRIIDTERHPHPRVGSRYRVWPLYNFANGIDDHLMGVTHIIRGKEHLTNQVRQEYMYRHFGWEYPEAIHYGRLKITGASLSKSKILQGLRRGLYEGWDDPRLATLAALRRRGIVPEAIRLLMIDVGPKAADAVLSWENLYAHNRKIIDPIANRYFFVYNPRKIIVKNLQRNITAQIPLHPDHPERGFRHFEIEPKYGEAPFWISSKDAETLRQGGKLRFMELFNLQIKAIKEGQIEALFHSQSYQEARNLGIPLIHWIPFNTGIASEVIMPDASMMKGVAEEACKGLRCGEIVQFERFGFVRVENLGEKLTTYFAHR